jgi:hypothetical protein
MVGRTLREVGRLSDIAPTLLETWASDPKGNDGQEMLH